MTVIAEALSYRTAYTPKGQPAHFATRQTTNDAALIAGIMGEDEYGFAQMEPVTGWIIDIGAHIGIVTMILALDNPDTQIVAVEAVPSNAEILRRNVKTNRLEERVFVEEAAAASPKDKTVDIIFGYQSVGVADGVRGPVIDAPYVLDNRYVGNIFEYGDEQTAETLSCPALSLSAILAKYEIDRVALLKIDCEGCEWAFLTDPATDRIDRIIGEFHGTPQKKGIAEVRKLLPNHDVTHIRGEVVGIFDAVHR